MAISGRRTSVGFGTVTSRQINILGDFDNPDRRVLGKSPMWALARLRRLQ
jgi:hypothetical protein